MTRSCCSRLPTSPGPFLARPGHGGVPAAHSGASKGTAGASRGISPAVTSSQPVSGATQASVEPAFA